jgi:Arc/MetJ family transcription regulator
MWHHNMPNRIKNLMSEVYAALHNDSRRLALMGARTIVDLLLVDKVGDAGSFAVKLHKLEAQGFIGKQSIVILGAALDAGSAAAHRAYKPTIEHLNQVMDIVENLIQSVYVLDKAATEIRGSTPKRTVKHRA